MRKRSLILLLFVIIQSCNNSTSNNKRIWYTYLYYQKLAEKDAGCKDENDINCQDEFNIIWPRYYDRIKNEFRITDQYLDGVITSAINNEAATKDWTDSRLTERQLKNKLKSSNND